jgi:tripartite-type tricarboxylate transporter receptor subunit TctC
VAAVLAEARARPGLGLSHGGIGTPSHLAVVQLQIATGLEFTPVGYRGGGPQLIGLVTGEVPYGFSALSSALAHVAAGRLRALAVSGAARAPLLPAVPSLAEAGWPAVDVLGEWGFVAPPGLAEPVRDRLHALLLAPTLEPALRARLEAQAYGVVASSPAAHAAQIRREVAQWREVAARGAIRVE